MPQSSLHTQTHDRKSSHYWYAVRGSTPPDSIGTLARWKATCRRPLLLIPEFCPGGLRQRLTVNKSTLLV